MLTTLLNTKSHIPTPDEGIIPRERLFMRLNLGLKKQLIHISAPAGSGKTTLVSTWLKSHPQLAQAWMSLDAEDNNPLRFLAYLAHTLETIIPEAGSTLQKWWDMSWSHLMGTGISPMTPLINAIQAFHKPLVLVLDDCHVIDTNAIFDLLANLIDRQPPNLHLVVISRGEAPLPLSRLRVRGQLIEIRANHLAFTDAETKLFFQQRLHIHLAETDIQKLQRRTEGWAAALQLAGLALHDATQITDWIEEFSGDHAYIADYLTDEVLHHQSDEVREFLLFTSILERFNAVLCDAVTGKNNGARMLDYLRRANLFLVPLDDKREWFRYHHLFSELLLSRLLRDLPEQRSILHRRASDWLVQKGYPLEAIQHALKIPDYVRSAEIIEMPERNIFVRGEAYAVNEILRAIPQEVQWQRPRLNLLHAWERTTSGRITESQRYLQRVIELAEAENNTDPALWGEIRGVQGLHLLLQQQLPEAITTAQEALKLLPPSAAIYRGIVLMNLGLASLFSGHLETARHDMLEAVTAGEQVQELTIVVMPLCHLGLIDRTAGLLRQSETHYQKALTIAAEWKKSQHPLLSMVYVNLSQIYFEQNRLQDAKAMAEKCLAWGEWIVPPNYLLPAYMILAVVNGITGNKHTASEYFDKAAEIDRQYPDLPGADYAAWRVRYYLLTKNFAVLPVWRETEALAWDDRAALMLRRTADYLALAWVLIVEKSIPAACKILDTLSPALAALQHRQAQIETLILQAMALAETSAAYDLLAKAVQMAESGGYVRLFVDKGETIARLLRSGTWNAAIQPYVAQLLSHFPAETPPEALTERELELLYMVAAGLSNQAIADQLFLSLSTVKWHLNNLYSKLGVRSRTQALVRAKELNLL